MEGQPTEAQERSLIADKIRQFRENPDYKAVPHERTKFEYLEVLGGLKASLDYARTLPSKTILDIGSGSYQGVESLSQSFLGKGLEFWTTELNFRQYSKEEANIKKHLITSAEVLRGVNEASVGMVMAVNSIAYSGSPRMTINRIDQVLVPGGILKASFVAKPATEKDLRFGFQTHDQFSEELLRRGFQIALLERLWADEDVILAIKPSTGDFSVNPVDLLKRDIESFTQQYPHQKLILAQSKISALKRVD